MADIVLRDRSGSPVEYPGVERIKLNTTGGGTKEFIDPDTVPQAVEKTIDPDFSAGDMEVIPEDGQVFSKVGISMPTNLLPGNIAEGVDIAGIIGTLTAGGSARFACGKKTNTSKTITHNLGIVPDFVIVFPNITVTVGSYYDYMLVYMSDTLKNATSSYHNCFSVYTSSNKALYFYKTTATCTNTEITFSRGTFDVSGTYYWLAIGGLT